MKKINFLKIFWVLFYITIFFILLNNSLGYIDPDMGWHLKVGEEILANKEVPNYEIYNYTLEGQTWVDHEWLINAITYWIYDNLGYMALNVFFVLIIIITLLILHLITYKYFLKEKNGLIFFILFAALGIIASQPHLGVRMQEITLLNISLLLLIIYHFNENKNYNTLLFLLPLFYLWSSMHAGFLMGIFILSLWIFIKIAENILAKYNFFKFIDYKNKISSRNIFYFTSISLLAISTTLITLYGPRLYHFLTLYKNDLYLTTIVEWFPFYYLPIEYWQILFSSLILLVIGFISYSALRKNNKENLSLWNFFILIFFLIFALKSKRHFPPMFVISLPIIAGYFSSFLNSPKDNFLNNKWPKQFFIIKPYLIIGFLIIISSKIITTNYVANPFVSFEGSLPAGAVTYLKNHPEYNNLNIFNQYKWGGYLIWALPEKKIFIDGRLPMLPYKNRTLLEEYLDFFKKDKSEASLNDNNIGLVLIPDKKNYIKLNWFEKYFLYYNEEKINNRENPLKNYLNDSGNWELIYNDEISNIYIRI